MFDHLEVGGSGPCGPNGEARLSPVVRPFPHVGPPHALTDAARAAASEDVRAASDDELLERLAQVEAARRSLEAASAHLVAELEARSVAYQRYGTRTRPYLSAQFRMDPRAAGRLLRSGRILRRLAVVDAALQVGAVTLEHVGVLAGLCNPRAAHVVEGVQGELVALAGTLHFDVWVRQCRALVDLADADGGHRPTPEDRRLSWGRGLDGVLHLSGTLVGVEAVAFEHVLEAHTDRLFRRSRSDAAASGELRPPTRSQLRAVVVDSLGVPLDLGRAVRFVTVDQRRALAARDGGCVFPGCSAGASWTDAHHVVRVVDGGATDLANVARGAHVVTDDLVAALRSSALGGAGLDVTDPEPLPADHPLWSAPNCVITPHVGNTPAMAWPLLAERIRMNVARWIAGEPLVGPVDVAAGY